MNMKFLEGMPYWVRHKTVKGEKQDYIFTEVNPKLAKILRREKNTIIYPAMILGREEHN